MRQGATNAPIPSNYEHTPLMVSGLLYMSTGYGTAAALDPATGKVVWFDAPLKEERTGPNRGLAYWTDGKDKRVLALVGQYLVALNSKTGKRIAGFGNGGRVDLSRGYRRPTDSFRWNSPPLVVRDVIVVGGLPGGAIDVVNDQQLALREMPPGDVRG